MLIHPTLDLLKPVHSDEFLPPIHLWVRLGGIALVGAVGIVAALTAVIPYSVVVQAPGTVRPSGELRMVQAETEGVVSQIAVQENQQVQRGDAIAYLDASQSQTQQNQLQDNIQKNQQQLTQIAAQIRALDSQRLAETAVSDRTIAAATADLQRTQRDYHEKQTTAQTELQEVQAEVELAKEKLARYQQLASTGAIPQLDIKEKEESYKAALARLERAQAKVDPSDASVTIATEQIAQQTAQGKAALAKLEQERDQLMNQHVELENHLNRDRQALQQLLRDRQKTVVRATATGTILKLSLRNSGQVVRLGDAIAQIAPHQSALIIKAHVAAQDISQVQVCQQEHLANCQVGKVELRISAYPYPDYGTLKGWVVAIAPDTTTTQTGNLSASSASYEVTIEPETPFLSRAGRNYFLQAGMDVTADIISKQETLLTFALRKARLLSHL